MAGRSGATVSVERGRVAVEDRIDHSTTLIGAGQRAKVMKGGSLKVSGKGRLPTIVRKGGVSPANDVARAASAVEQALADLEQAKATGDDKAIKQAEHALKDAAKNAERVSKDVAKSDEKAAKDAADATKAAVKAAEDAANEAEKTAKNLLKLDKGKAPKVS